MAELKTKKTALSVDSFIRKVPDGTKRKDSETIIAMMKRITKSKPSMWGPSIIGFGTYKYRYPDGREMDWPITGFSPRKQNLVLYIMSGLHRHEKLLRRLGKHSTGKSCLYVKRLSDVDLAVLEELIEAGVKRVLKK
ncbi:MAG: DUF1801 domain-containing protein [Bacteroidota bacterium]